jgi:hypothetical protein
VGGSKIPILAAVLVAAGAWGYFTYGPKAKPPAEPVLTAEARAYLPNLPLSDVAMEASDSTIKMSITTVKGKIGNTGQKTVSSILVTCVFHDVNGQVIKRERVSLAGPRTGALTPGSIKSFEVNFDNIPETWNQALPDLVIAEIQFGG